VTDRAGFGPYSSQPDRPDQRAIPPSASECQTRAFDRRSPASCGACAPGEPASNRDVHPCCRDTCPSTVPQLLPFVRCDSHAGLAGPHPALLRSREAVTGAPDPLAVPEPADCAGRTKPRRRLTARIRRHGLRSLNGQRRSRHCERNLVALGIVNVNWNEQRDSVGNFVPFVAQALKDSSDDVVALADLQQAITARFGLQIPQGALRTILRRAAREGYVAIEHGVYRPSREALANVNLDRKRSDMERQRVALIEALRQFAHDHHRQAWSEDQAGDALLSYVRSQAAPLLATAVAGEPFRPPPAVRHGEVIVSRFVLHVCRDDPTAFSQLDTFVKGYMLANVLYLPEGLDAVNRRFGDTCFLLDTPVVLRAVGYAQEEISRPASELLHLLQGYNAKLRIFGHTLREIEGVLDSAASSLRRGGVTPFEGSVYEYFVSHGLESADAERMIAALPERLARAGIEVVEAPPQTERLAVDEARLKEILEAEVTYHRDETLYRDLDSLTACHRLRDGRFYPRFEACPAIFVTSNGALARASRIFFREAYGRQAIPVTVLDHSLTTIAWLKDPARAATLPRHQMIADSFAALDPPDTLWQSYVEEITRLQRQGEITEHDFALLRYSMDARQALMDITLGDAEVFSEGTVHDVLEHARRAAAADAAEEGRQAAIETQRTRYRDVSAVVGRWVARAVILAAGVALVVGVAAATSGIFPREWTDAVPWTVSACIVFAALFGLANGILGISLRQLASSFERSVARWTFRALVAVFAAEGDARANRAAENDARGANRPGGGPSTE
jgi:hypothetical protein